MGSSGGTWQQCVPLLGFFDAGNLVILTNGFAQKIQKTPPEEIELAEKRKKEYLRRRKYE